MTTVSKTLILFLSATMVMASPALEAKKKPPKTPKTPRSEIQISKPLNVRNPSRADRTHTSRAQMAASSKAAHKRGKATLKTARKDLVRVKRSELRSRKLFLSAKTDRDAALAQMRANRTPRTEQQFRNADNRMRPLERRYNQALSTKLAQDVRIQRLVEFQRQALSSINEIRNIRPRPARGRSPRFNQSARVNTRRAAYDTVPQSQLLVARGAPYKRATLILAESLPNPPRGNPAAAPRPSQLLLAQGYTPGPLRQNRYEQTGDSFGF